MVNGVTTHHAMLMSRILSSHAQPVEAFWSFFFIWLAVLCAQSLSGIARQWSRKKFAILTLKPRSHVYSILIHRRTWAICIP